MAPYRIIKEAPHRKNDGTPCPGGEIQVDLNYAQTIFALRAASQGIDFTSGVCPFCREPRPSDGEVDVEINIEDIPLFSEDPEDTKIRKAAIMAQVNIEDNKYPHLHVVRPTR